MRMVRAVALFALVEAVRHGEYHATFHGFRVESLRRKGLGDSTASIEVSLAVTRGGTVVERIELDVEAVRASCRWDECRRTWPIEMETFIDGGSL
jgi:hypothetical protein